MTDYAFEGPVRSAPQNITYAWGNASTTSYSSSQSFTNAITGAYQTLVQQALAAWSAVANVTFTQVSSTTGAEIDFGWMNFTTSGQIGTTNYASYTTSANKQIFIPGTFVGFEDPAYRAVGSDQTSLYSGYNTTLYQIMLHEIGHALGLAHTTNPNTLMYPTLGPSDRGISQYDITGIQTLYGAPGTAVSSTTISTIAISADSNVVGDFVTNVASQTVTATLSAPLASGETLMASANGGATWTDVSASVAGRMLTWNGVTLAGTSNILLKVTNATGDGAVASQAYTLDVVAPAIPSATLSPGSDSGVVTTVTRPTVTGYAEANATVRLLDSDGTTVLGTTVASPAGTFSITSASLGEGTHRLAVQAIDLAGNVSAASPVLQVTIDPPPPPPTPTTPTSNVVYRFFDSTHGTQFLTSNANERDTIIATRPDLAYEGKAMGTVDPDPTNPNVAPVFRFFDGSNGTHFFTTSTGERDQILATRHDMVLEQANMFEHATQQAGDVAVYRFFVTTDGSHFFTSNAAEIAAIGQSRPDMIAEDVAFYSPKV